MTTPPHDPQDAAGRRREAGRPDSAPDRSPLNWLLLLPLLATLYPPLYNHRRPDLLGIPFFYWYQLLAVGLGVLCTYAVYRATTGGRR